MYSPHILCLENSSEQEIDGFRTYSRDYSLNCTPLGPITITYYWEQKYNYVQQPFVYDFFNLESQCYTIFQPLFIYFFLEFYISFFQKKE